MNVDHSMCASSGKALGWDHLKWSRHERQVRRLQARIVKATRVGRRGKVQALQRLLTHSFSGKALAVKRVAGNKGKRTSGVDGAIWMTPESKYKAIGTLKRRGYQPLPLKRVYIPKPNGKLRPLGIPAMKDRAMQALHLLALSPVAETTADRDSYGFRPARSTADAIVQCFILLSQKVSAKWVFEGDIRGCFDKISHEWMLANIPTDREVLGKWLRSGYVENRTLFPTKEGTPQGGIISPTAANMTLDGLEELLSERFDKRTPNPKVHLVRYADDFIITGTSQELLEGEVRPLVEQFLQERGLELSVEKSRITHISEGFDFLGHNLRQFDGRLLITPSKKNVKAFLEKVRAIIRASWSVDQEQLILELNPVILGWTNYHRFTMAARCFAKVDAAIWHALWRWAKRRHPTKPSAWVASKYWHTIGPRSWMFAVDTGEVTSKGKPIMTVLARASAVRIKRHTKIKKEANPFNPRWRDYFEERVLLKRYGAELLEQFGSLLRKAKPVVKTGSAQAGL